MKRKLLNVAVALGLFVGGFGAASYFSSLDISTTRDAKLADLPNIAEKIVRNSQVEGSAPQVAQVAAEASVQLQYAQVRQNAEIIRLLKKLAKE